MCQIWLRSDRRECNAGMTIAKCTKTAASSNVSNHLSRKPIARFASGAAHHARPYRNLGRRISLRSYTIVAAIAGRQIKMFTLVGFCGVLKHELLSLPIMFVMNLVISTDQLHYWELVMLYFMHAMF